MILKSIFTLLSLAIKKLVCLTNKIQSMIMMINGRCIEKQKKSVRSGFPFLFDLYMEFKTSVIKIQQFNWKLFLFSQYLCRTFPIVDEHVKEAMGDNLYDLFMVCEMSQWKLWTCIRFIQGKCVSQIRSTEIGEIWISFKYKLLKLNILHLQYFPLLI